MTDPPQGRDGAPSVAALAVRVNALRDDVGSLAAKLGALASTQHEHGTVLDDIPELRRQLERILTLLCEEDDATPGGWFWLTMNEQEREKKFGELYDWVETVLRPQYSDYLGEQIRPCWPNHPEARWELAWLYQLWSLAYLAKRPAPKDAADWHDRWSPGVIRRLSYVMRRCGEGCQSGPNLKAGVRRPAPL